MGVVTSSLIPHGIEKRLGTLTRLGFAERRHQAVGVGPAAIQTHHLARHRIDVVFRGTQRQ